MRWTLAISLMLHAAIILAAVIVLPSPEEFKVTPQEALPVEIVNIEDVSRRTAMAKDAPDKPVEKPAPEKAKPQPEPEPKPARDVRKVQPEPQPKPEPKPEPEPVKKAEPEPPAPDPADLKKLVEKVAPPEPEAKPEKRPAKPAPRPRARPKIIRKMAALERKKKKKRKNAIDDIAALLNKVDDTRQAPPPDASETGTPRRGPADMAGDDGRLSADLVDALRQKIESCWNIPAGVRDAQNLRVRIRFQMGEDGMVTGGPEVLNSMPHPAFGAAAQSAVRAVLACQPYDFLPVEKYAAWKDVILNFDPGRMLATN